MIELGKLFLPKYLDYKGEKGTITFRRPEFHSEDYFNDSECYLTIRTEGYQVYIDYYCEDEFYLSEIFELPTDYIECGNLETEKFEAIQSRALKVLINYIDDSKQEMMEYFDQL